MEHRYAANSTPLQIAKQRAYLFAVSIYALTTKIPRVYIRGIFLPLKIKVIHRNPGLNTRANVPQVLAREE